ncbi:methylmalonyl-CoA mutase family protein [Pelosinus sp. sgz500959]|uniref:methylmalonyl-CoA mutase family protein n=1 Tax=Pelosinus sp. sgz500959 TaxID=3242472 RepID=UPI00366E761E
MEKQNENLADDKPQERFFAEFPYPTYEEWRAESEKSLKGANWEKKLITQTYEGIALQPMYRMEDIEEIEHCHSLPGSFPFVRGTKSAGYLDKPWDISQECSEPLADVFNQVLQQELDKGGTGINVVLDQATQLGIDVDQADEHLIGKGLSLSTLDDLQRAFIGIDLENTPLFMPVGTSGIQMVSLMMALMKANGQDDHKLRGCIGVDPLDQLARTGELPDSLDTLYDEMAGLMTWVNYNNLKFRTILVKSQAYHDSGANAVQELAFSLATGVEYLRSMQERGVPIDVAAKQICFSFSVGTKFFMEISKLRAARMLWAQIVKAFGGNEEGQKMVIHARTSAFTKTVYDPYVNMLRTTTEAFSAVVGGVDSLHVGYFDEAIRPADTFSHRIARNTQIVLQQECNLTQPIDPAGGSWYVEKLTSMIGEKAWELFQEIEGAGGMFQSLLQKIPQEKIEFIAKKRAEGFAKRKDVILGTNMYPNLLEKPLDIPQFDYADFKKQRSSELYTYRNDMDEQECERRVRTLDKVDRGMAVITDVVIQAIFNGATLGEVTNSIRKNNGRKTVVTPLVSHRADEQYRTLREHTEAYKNRTGKNLEIFLVNMGPIPQHKARADFVSGFLEVGAFKMLRNDGFKTIDDAIHATIESGAPVAVICSTDVTYPELVPALAKGIKKHRPDITLFLAGLPPADLQDLYKEAGVDDFIHIKANCYQILAKLQKERGII